MKRLSFKSNLNNDFQSQAENKNKKAGSEVFNNLKGIKKVNYKGLSVKLVTTFVILIIVPIIIIGYISINTSSKSLIEKAKESLSNSSSQTENYYESMLEQIERGYATQVKFGYGVTDFFETKEYMDAKVEMEIKNTSERSIVNLVSTFPNTFSSAILIKDNGEVLATPTKLYQEMNLNTTKWYIDSTKNGKNVWIEDHSEGLPKEYDSDYILSYLSPYSLKTGGLLVLDIKASAFANLLSSVHVGNKSVSYIITPSNKVINQKGELDINVSVEKNNVLRDAVNYAKSNDKFVYTQNTNGINYIAAFSKSKVTGWIFVTAIPENEVTSITKSIKNQIIMLGIICALIAVLIGIWVSFTMTIPMKKLVVVMEQAAHGDLSANLLLKRSDEIGILTTSFNSMLGQIRDLVSQSKGLSNKVSKSSEDIAKISSKTNRITSEVVTTIQEIANGASNQADEIQKSLNAIFKFAEEIGKVVKSVEMMRSVSEEVRKITNSGIKTAVILNNKASETNKITTNVVDNIGHLHSYVQNINKVTKLLKTMSEQTKLLSLNASIESARAGEAGRGFSVVADEIRKLADQSSESTKEIDNIVHQILAQTQTSTELVLNAQKVISEQYAAVEDTSSMFEKIKDATNILNENMERISSQVNVMDTNKTQVILNIESSSSVSQETAAATEEVSASTQEQLVVIQELDDMTKQLEELSKNLNCELNKFNL